jgi:hypothetical protein
MPKFSWHLCIRQPLNELSNNCKGNELFVASDWSDKGMNRGLVIVHLDDYTGRNTKEFGSMLPLLRNGVHIVTTEPDN